MTSRQHKNASCDLAYPEALQQPRVTYPNFFEANAYVGNFMATIIKLQSEGISAHYLNSREVPSCPRSGV